MKCPVCNESIFSTIFKCNDQPLARYGLCLGKDDALAVERYPIEIKQCDFCNIIFNSKFSYSKINYSSNLVKESRVFSPRIKNYMVYQANKLKLVIDLKLQEIVEIGCGDGFFLNLFSDDSNLIGFEPSTESTDAVEKNIHVIKDYFNPNIDYQLSPKLIILRQVLEHLENPISYIEAFYRLLSKENRSGYIYIEVPNGNLTLNSLRFYDIYFEHYLYFTIKSLQFLLEKCGFRIIHSNEDLDSELITILAVVNTDKSPEIRFFDKKEKLISKINNIFSCGKKIVAWGVSGNGSSLLNICNFDTKLIEYVIDSDIRKHGFYVPGTAQLVVSPEYLKDTPPDVILILSQLHKKDIIEQIYNIYGAHIEIIIPDEIE